MGNPLQAFSLKGHKIVVIVLASERIIKLMHDRSRSIEASLFQDKPFSNKVKIDRFSRKIPEK